MIITDEAAKTALSRFLAQQISDKTDKLQKQLASAQKKNRQDDVIKHSNKIDKIKTKYKPDNFLDVVVNEWSKKLKLGTHISKGIHPSSKGDNIAFVAKKTQDESLIGTHSLNRPAIDAGGNAAALPLASFFDFDAADGVKVRDLILNDNQTFILSLSTDETLAHSYHTQLKEFLLKTVKNPVTHELNKQMLYVTNDRVADNLEDLCYINIVPLYPSALTYEIYLKINQARYSDENKKALENRFKPNAEHTPYVSMPNMAVVQLGGSKPQNISRLISRQKGRNYLLPSLPPKIERNHQFVISKLTQNIFDSKHLNYYIKDDFELIKKVVRNPKNNINVRNQRKDAIQCILHTIFAIAHDLQNQPAGWSKNYALSLEQKIWLDPHRADLEGEEEFFEQKAKNTWQKVIMEDFALWLNKKLKAQFKKLEFDFADAEFYEWQQEIEKMKGFYERLGKGVFL